MTLFTRQERGRLQTITALGLVTLAAVLLRLAFYDYSPGSEFFHPHGYCYLWQPALVSAHVVSDALIGLSYVAISLTLIFLVRSARQHLPFSWMFVAFGGFIIACGATHFVEIWTLWTPLFWLAADVKIITAAASVLTAVLLPPLVPKVLQVVAAARVSDERRIALEDAHAEMERRVEERTRELRSALERAEDANRMKEAFLSTVSHELRTPLNAILGWSSMLTRKDPNPALLARGLSVIERNAWAQVQLVEDLLDISRMTAGTLRLELQPTDLAGVVRDAVDVVRPSAEAKHVSMQLAMDSAARLVVLGDARRLQQVLWNLLSNAVKFTPDGGRVEIGAMRRHGRVVVEVRDTGIGIDPSFLPKLFDRFSQADPSSTRSHHGLGIGLAIARHLVELHGGDLRAESAGEGKGATFTLELPVRENMVLASARTDGAEQNPRLDAVRVLVVDDEPDAREMLGTILEEAGALVTTADSADAALHQLSGGDFDVVLSDVAMPARDGLTLVRELRASNDQRLQTIPAIAVSAYARREDQERALRAGFQLHITKPVAPGDLIQGIAAILPRGA